MLALISPEEVQFFGGLPPEAVVGIFDAGGTAPENFRPNRVFIDFMHEVIGAAAPRDPSFLAAARQHGDGWLYIIDLRTPNGPQGDVPAEDIVGAFEVRSGELVPNSYQRFPGHRVFTTNGMVQLPPFLRESFLSELRRRNPPAG